MRRPVTVRNTARLRRRRASEYASWLMMRARCRARGIPVAARWENFEAFLEDLGPRPRGHALVRSRPDAPFAPRTCSWQPIAERARRRRRNRLSVGDVARIRLKYRHGAQRAELARLYGVSLQHMCLICSGRRWRPAKEKVSER